MVQIYSKETRIKDILITLTIWTHIDNSTVTFKLCLKLYLKLCFMKGLRHVGKVTDSCGIKNLTLSNSLTEVSPSSNCQKMMLSQQFILLVSCVVIYSWLIV